jgi:hydroxymethylpyrimidine/phosphomethylpyrimidine kinase
MRPITSHGRHERTAIRAALTIAGSDPSGGAGIQADMKTFAALGVYGATAITAITVQNTRGVTAVHPLPTDLIVAQIEAIAADIRLHATKIGMLATAAIVEVTAAAIAELELPLVVVDPVLVATSGKRLLDEDGVRALVTELLPRALVVTPNIPEAEVLSGCAIRTADDLREAAVRIQRLGPAVILTGGHREGTEVIDVLFDGSCFTEFRAPRVDTSHTHGSGCTFASAVAAHLALGYDLVDATGRAHAYVAGAIAHAQVLGRGSGPLGHFWNMRPAAVTPDDPT